MLRLPPQPYVRDDSTLASSVDLVTDTLKVSAATLITQFEEIAGRVSDRRPDLTSSSSRLVRGTHKSHNPRLPFPGGDAVE